MAEDMQGKLTERLKQVKIAIQLDESTFIASAAQCWFMFDIAGKDRLWKTFCFPRRFQGRTTGEELFNVLGTFLYNRDWR